VPEERRTFPSKTASRAHERAIVIADLKIR